MKLASRMDRLPPYLFAEIDRRIEEARASGVDVISLGIGDPDRPTPPAVVEALGRAAREPRHHRYPPYAGLKSFREAVARWFARRFGVELDPEREVLVLIGSKEGLAHLAWAVMEPGAVALVPDPGYPVYQSSVLLAGGEVWALPLRAEAGFLPDLDAVPQEVLRRARLLFLNYPNNPTGATADLAFFERVVEFARAHGLLICHDAAYSEITYDGYRAPSILQISGARDVAIELHSLSKSFNMTGWRLGWACGSPEAVEALGRLKTNLDSGVFGAIQEAAVEALDHHGDFSASMSALYRGRRDRVVEALRRMGWPVRPPLGAIYLWIPVPPGWDSIGFAARLLESAGVVVTPGVGYGRQGEGYVRISLTIPDDRLDEAMRRWEASGLTFRPRTA
ncbi:LL-diaminopimelate aminotransferase [Carboxydochorda subterranea]|uniref:Aminotransferase n=1 Tax=Carboxydichorda subterranea TaxID=3109565 RepID=A0ABZ1C0F7_9FIRM|nr:LL-diaminopimelate aminotransferase [Limnochorda sp. L945t]WRP18512.1 LL-diaminopimelate aminotransferase [Limnochorda sp. L945t]